MHTRKDAILYFKCSRDLRRAIEEEARRQDESLSSVIRRLIAGGIRQPQATNQPEARAHG